MNISIQHRQRPRSWVVIKASIIGGAFFLSMLVTLSVTSPWANSIAILVTSLLTVTVALFAVSLRLLPEKQHQPTPVSGTLGCILGAGSITLLLWSPPTIPYINTAGIALGLVALLTPPRTI